MRPESGGRARRFDAHNIHKGRRQLDCGLQPNAIAQITMHRASAECFSRTGCNTRNQMAKPLYLKKYPQGVTKDDLQETIDDYCLLKQRYLQDELTRLQRESIEDSQKKGRNSKVRSIAQKEWANKINLAKEANRMFIAERKSLGVDRRRKREKVEDERWEDEKKALAKWRGAKVIEIQSIHPTMTPKEARKQLDDNIILARSGDFDAYIRVNGYPASQTLAVGMPLDMSESHWDIAHDYAARLICQHCGRYHQQEIQSNIAHDGSLLPLRCPHCDTDNCAGIRNHGINAPRGLGKSETAKHFVSFMGGLWLYRDYSPEIMVIGANIDEATARSRSISDIMSRPGHRAIFNSTFGKGKRRFWKCVPKSGSRAVNFHGQSKPIIVAYGITGAPPGHHCDLLFMDDICNRNNTLLKPSMMIQVWQQYTEVLAKSVMPWTLTVFIGTPWVRNDANSRLRKLASTNPGSWKFRIITCGGPDSNPPFYSPAPKQIPPSYLKEQYELDPRAYERGFMMKEIAASEIVFRDISCWVHNKEKLNKAQKAVAGDCPSIEGDLAALVGPKIIGLDAGYTGAESDTHNRSQTGICVLWYDLANQQILVLHTTQGYLSPRELKTEVRMLAHKYNVKWLAIEIGGAMIETVTYFEDKGFDVERYVPSRYGAKAIRKAVISEPVNNGQILLRGHPLNESNKPKLRLKPITAQQCLEEAMMIFPAEVHDILDALEIGARTLMEVHGQLFSTSKSNAPLVVVEQDSLGLMAHKAKAYAGQKKKDTPDARQEEIDLDARLLYDLF